MFNRAKAGKVDATRSSSTTTSAGSPTRASPTTSSSSPTDVSYAKQWGMNTEIEDLRRVVKQREKRGGKVVVGGHSLGGSITTAYATWDFKGKAGAKGLSGLVFIDGGSGPTPITRGGGQPARWRRSTGRLARGSRSAASPRPSPGCSTPSGALGALQDPNEPSLGSGLAAAAGEPEAAGRGRPTPGSTATRWTPRPRRPALVAAQAHLGRLAASGDPRGWERAGELTPIRRYADDVLRLGPEEPRRHRLVPPAAPDDRLGRRGGRQRRTRRRRCSTCTRPTATTCRGSCGSTRSAPRSAASACSTRRTALASQSGIPKRNLKLVDRARRPTRTTTRTRRARRTTS